MKDGRKSTWRAVGLLLVLVWVGACWASPSGALSFKSKLKPPADTEQAEPKAEPAPQPEAKSPPPPPALAPQAKTPPPPSPEPKPEAKAPPAPQPEAKPAPKTDAYKPPPAPDSGSQPAPPPQAKNEPPPPPPPPAETKPEKKSYWRRIGSWQGPPPQLPGGGVGTSGNLGGISTRPGTATPSTPGPPPAGGGNLGGITTRPGTATPGYYRPPGPPPGSYDYPRGGYWFYDQWGNLYYYDGYRPPMPVGSYYSYPRYGHEPEPPSVVVTRSYRDEDFAGPGSLEEAAEEISRAWEREEIGPLLRHLKVGWRVRFYDGNEYSHALAADALREVTEGIWASIRTREYRLAVHRVLPGGDWAVLKGRHVYQDQEGREVTLYLRYLMCRNEGGAWLIREISLSDVQL